MKYYATFATRSKDEDTEKWFFITRRCGDNFFTPDEELINGSQLLPLDPHDISCFLAEIENLLQFIVVPINNEEAFA